MRRFAFIVLINLMVGHFANALSSQVGQYEVSVATGPLMTSNRYAALDSIMTTSLRMGYAFEHWRPVLHYAMGENNISESVEVIGIGFKNPFQIDELGGFHPFFQFGAQTSNFKPRNYRNNGFNLGFGMDVELTQSLHLRTDFGYFNEGIHKYMLLTLGLQLVFGSSAKGANN